MRAGTHHVGRATALFRGEGARRARALLLALASSALLAPTGCGAGPPSGRPPNIVLVSIDSLRADRLGCYGAERDTSPSIDALAAEGARFANAMAPTVWTLPSHVTLFTGLPVPAHRVRTRENRIDPERRLLAEHLRRSGYRTAAFVSAPFLHEAYGFGRGFDVYQNFQGAGNAAWPPDPTAKLASHDDETAPRVLESALAWLSERPVGKDGPWFLFVHFWDVHYDYIPPPPYDALFDPDYAGSLDSSDFENSPAIHPHMDARDLAHVKALYDGEVRWVDTHVGRLVETLRARESQERILLALVADHGDEFFEHGMKGHYKQLFEESARVPWLLRFPGVVPPGAVFPEVVGLVDVAPTLLGLAGVPPLPEAQGHDLSAGIQAGALPAAEQLITLHAQAALRGPGWKVLLDTTTGYAVHYDLVADPMEQDPRPARREAPERLRRLSDRLHEVSRYANSLTWSGEGSVELDEYTMQRLRALGYAE